MTSVTGTRISFDEAIAEALRMEMHRDPSMVIFSATSNGVAGQLANLFGPERVIETHAVGAPIVLAASGAAEEGMRPVCELGPAEAGPAALDQIAELAAIHAANLGTMRPLTVRLSWGDPLAAGGVAATDPLCWLLGAEGLKVVAPATAADAKGLTIAAVRDPDPVCVLEHAALRAAIDPVPEGAHLVEIGRARLVCEGAAMTIVTHGAAVAVAEQTISDHDLDADLLDLRTLQPLDSAAVLTSVRKTGRVLFVEPLAAAHRVTAELVSAVWEEAFEYLDAPPRRVRLGEPATVIAVNGAGPRSEDVETIKGASRELLAY